MRSVIERFIQQATEDDYASGLDSDGARSRVRPLGGLLAGGVAAIIVIVLAVGVSTARSTVDERAGTRGALIERVTSLQVAVAAEQERVDSLTNDVADLSSQIDAGVEGLGSGSESSILASRAGMSDLSDEGITVVIDDAPGAEAGSLNRVLDRDLQDIVNALWQMGAAGVAVNGQRLTQTSAIRGAGEAILVNYRPLERPYEISAAGVPTSESSRVQQILDQLGSDYGLVSRVTAGDVALPAGQMHLPLYAVSTDQTQEAP